MNYPQQPAGTDGNQVRYDPGPSRTSQVVALTRAGISRPHSPEGDPDAQRALCAGLAVTPPAWLQPSIEVRTRFMDEQVLTSIGAGVRQIVICGVGLDDRGLRFRTTGVRFFEVDHPVTQADKARRLRDMGVGIDEPTLAACDFQSESIAGALEACGHVATLPTLFLCEGLLVYLDQQAGRRLLTESASRAATGSVLAASLATHDSGLRPDEVAAAANARRRAGNSEPWRTILPAGEYLAMLANTGWAVTGITEPVPSADAYHVRRSLLVTATPVRRDQ